MSFLKMQLNFFNNKHLILCVLCALCGFEKSGLVKIRVYSCEFVVTFVPFVMKIICVNLRNLWFPFCLSVFVSWWLCGYESIMQNKPNLLDT